MHIANKSIVHFANRSSIFRFYKFAKRSFYFKMANKFTANEMADMVPEYDSESDITVSDLDEYFPSTSDEYSSDVSFMCAERPPTTSRASTDTISDYCSSSDESDINTFRAKPRKSTV